MNEHPGICSSVDGIGVEDGTHYPIEVKTRVSTAEITRARSVAEHVANRNGIGCNFDERRSGLHNA